MAALDIIQRLDTAAMTAQFRLGLDCPVAKMSLLTGLRIIDNFDELRGVFDGSRPELSKTVS